MDLREEKQALRRLLKEQRAALSAEHTCQWDNAIAQNVINSQWFAKADTLFAYISVGREVDTASIIAAAHQLNKQVAVPRCGEKGSMSFYIIDGLDDLTDGKYGIPEPADHCLPAAATSHSLCLVPALAFDQNGFRIGYGGGYYDRFLAEFPGKSLGLVRSAFLLERIPAERHDLPVDGVVTEQFI
ncbi:MAG: 5-formyltetrahydrofolate cyclo-ligase [Oscillospiraceae bacterium]|nr:5-formyltetrahydrofolate cyclo-ligase [Oscillospiraceae bacterium]